MIERTILTGTHGRYLVRPPAPGTSTSEVPVLFGFHGYGEGAEIQLERMRAIPGADGWRLVSIQGLHRFYQRRTNEVVASWMTRQDRVSALVDNAEYVTGVMNAVAHEWADPSRVLFAGFSQGVAMAFRAAVAASLPVNGVIAVGGDVPPELDAASLSRIPAVLYCRGSRDEWYTAEKFEADVARLRVTGIRVLPLEFEGGHEWSDGVQRAASDFLNIATSR